MSKLQGKKILGKQSELKELMKCDSWRKRPIQVLHWEWQQTSKKKTVVSRQHFFHSVSLMGDKTEGWKETLNVMRILIFTSLWQYFENIFKQCSSSTAANALIKLNTNWCATSYLRIHKFQWRPGPAWSPAPFLLNLPIGSNQQGYNFSEEQNIRNQSSTGHSCKY